MVLIFATFWIFNTYFLPKPEQSNIQTNAVENVSTQRNLNKPAINMTDAGVVIYTEYANGEIRYNFDGNEPTQSDKLYSGVIALEGTDLDISKLRAKVFTGDRSSSTSYFVRDLVSNEIIQASDLTNVVLKNDLMEVELSPMDGQIVKVYLNGYETDYASGMSSTQLVPDNSGLGKVKFSGIKLENQIYFKEQLSDNAVKFYLKDKEGNPAFSKTFVLKDDYQIDFTLEFDNPQYQTDYSMEFAGIADTENLTYKNEKPKKYFKSKERDYKFIALDNNEIMTSSLTKLKKYSEKNEVDSSESDNVKWAAIRSKYFVISLFTTNVSADKKLAASMMNESPAFDINISNADFDNNKHSYNLYVGPVLKEAIEQYDKTLEFDRVIERSISWLHWLARLAELALEYLGKFIPNFGFVIIIFTILIRLILFPLTHKGMAAGTKQQQDMQKVKPQLDAVRKKYKSDPMKMQQETKRIYQENGVSMFGGCSGCLPMAIQMPILFAIYPVIRYSISLRGAHFIGWLHDLSQPDPFYILPIIMGLFMFIQQKMMLAKQAKNNTVAQDDMQASMQQSQKMMAYVMPVMMVWIFKSLPAGLVLYFTVSNILSIIQQYIINKKLRG